MEDQIMALVRWNQPTLATLMDDFFGKVNTNGISYFEPAVNVIENKDVYELQLAIPGYSKDEVKLSIENNTLTISAEYEEKKEEEVPYSRREFVKTSFERSFSLPRSIDQDKVEASFENGILKIKLPRKGDLVVKKEITIN
jgi:HSP20 family protein